MPFSVNNQLLIGLIVGGLLGMAGMIFHNSEKARDIEIEMKEMKIRLILLEEGINLPPKILKELHKEDFGQLPDTPET